MSYQFGARSEHASAYEGKVASEMQPEQPWSTYPPAEDWRLGWSEYSSEGALGLGGSIQYDYA